MDLVQHNAEITAEFRRLNPGASLFGLHAWYATMVRDVKRDVGWDAWSVRTKPEQHQLLMEFLNAKPTPVLPAEVARIVERRRAA